MIKKSTSIISCIFIFQFIGYFLGQITQINISTWYQTLHKSSLTPPAIIFPIAWSILYTMIAVSGWLLWQHRRDKDLKTQLAIIFFSIQMMLNWAWPLLFFNFHLISVSFICLLLMMLLTLTTIFLTKDTLKLSSMLLIPYFLWLSLAAYLNGVIWMLD